MARTIVLLHRFLIKFLIIAHFYNNSDLIQIISGITFNKLSVRLKAEQESTVKDLDSLPSNSDSDSEQQQFKSQSNTLKNANIDNSLSNYNSLAWWYLDQFTILRIQFVNALTGDRLRPSYQLDSAISVSKIDHKSVTTVLGRMSKWCECVCQSVLQKDYLAQQRVLEEYHSYSSLPPSHSGLSGLQQQYQFLINYNNQGPTPEQQSMLLQDLIMKDGPGPGNLQGSFFERVVKMFLHSEKAGEPFYGLFPETLYFTFSKFNSRMGGDPDPDHDNIIPKYSLFDLKQLLHDYHHHHVNQSDSSENSSNYDWLKAFTKHHGPGRPELHLVVRVVQMNTLSGNDQDINNNSRELHDDGDDDDIVVKPMF